MESPRRASHWTVHKFGGTSAATSQRIMNIPVIISKELEKETRVFGSEGRILIVVSAMAGVTNELLECVAMAEKRNLGYLERIQAIRQKHISALNDILGEGEANATLLASMLEKLESDVRDVSDLLHTTSLVRKCSKTMKELIQSYGELWSSRSLYAAFTSHFRGQGLEAEFLDSREIIHVTDSDIGPAVDWGITLNKIGAWNADVAHHTSTFVIAPGFICTTVEGLPATLARNGSDFSATIFGSLLDAEHVHIWTDVDGIFSADPRKVTTAVLLERMSYKEALELSYFGAKVLHHQSISPCMAKGIPICIRNTFNPSSNGTEISANGARPGSRSKIYPYIVKGFSLIENVALVNVEGTGMCGVPGVAERIFSALKSASLSVILITQASSEHSVCFAVPEHQADAAREVVGKAFSREINQNMVQTVDTLSRCAILAAVGDAMIHMTGVAARFLTAIAQAEVNVLALAQGSSERNISIVVKQRDSARALMAAHNAFYKEAALSLSVPATSTKKVAIAIVGFGLVGRELARQLLAQAPKLRAKYNFEFQINALVRTKGMVLFPTQPSFDSKMTIEQQVTSLSEELERNCEAASMTKLAAFMQDKADKVIIVDCTSSEDVAGRYNAFLRCGINIVAANKKLFSGPFQRLKQVWDALATQPVQCLHEATVGAGLPVIKILKELLDTGDEVIQIQGVLSGTLSYIFNELRKGTKTFSEIVMAAKALGYTEPDPRDDLSGQDVGRKIVILARECGLQVSLENLQLESLVPTDLRDCSVEEFLRELPRHDEAMRLKLEEAKARGSTYIYCGEIDVKKGTAKVEMQELPLEDPLGTLTGAENMVTFRTIRYDKNPLIIRGPGAGAAVTAGGAFADILNVVM